MQIISHRRHPKPVITSEPISEETLAEFPDLPNHGPYAGSTIGYETPTDDQVHIRDRSQALRKELSGTPKRLQNLEAIQKVAVGVYLASAVALSTAVTFGTLGAVAGVLSPELVGSTVIGSGATLITSGVIGGFAADRIHQGTLDYYEYRTELDHLKRDEIWKPTPSYIPGDRR